MLADIISKEEMGDNCTGTYKNKFQGIANVCYASISMGSTTEIEVYKCPYFKEKHELQIGGKPYIHFFTCKYEVETNETNSNRQE